MAWPEPSGPVRKTTLPIRERTGSTASIAAASPPAMIASEPSPARLSPPETGAARDRRVDETDGGTRELGAEGARADRIGRAHVDDDRVQREVWAHRRQDG